MKESSREENEKILKCALFIHNQADITPAIRTICCRQNTLQASGLAKARLTCVTADDCY